MDTVEVEQRTYAQSGHYVGLTPGCWTKCIRLWYYPKKQKCHYIQGFRVRYFNETEPRTLSHIYGVYGEPHLEWGLEWFDKEFDVVEQDEEDDMVLVELIKVIYDRDHEGCGGEFDDLPSF